MLDVRTLPPGHELITGPRYQLGALVRDMCKRGEVEMCHPMRPVAGRPGAMYVVVKRLREPRPRWHKPAAIGAGVVATVSGVGALVAWAVRALTEAVSQAGPALGGIVALSLLVLAVAYTRRPRHVEGTFRARIR